jgi:mono/diheme cytochrome c family protein
MRGSGSARIPLLLVLGGVMGATAPVARAQPLGSNEEWQAPAEWRARFNPLAATPDVLKKGRSIFVQHCLLCHGEKGVGDGPLARMHTQRTGVAPRDLSSTHVQAEMTDGEILWKVTNGWRRQGRIIMPAFGEDRSQSDLWSVVVYIRSLNRQEAAK